MERAMTPTSVFIVLMLAFVIDYMSIGRDSLRDRVAFLLAIAGFRDGFNGSPADRWTVGKLSDGIGWLLDQTNGAYIAGASINIIIGAGVGVLAIYATGCLVPDRASKKLGRWAALNFPTSSVYRINWKLWGIAFLLGVLADLGRGLVGELTNTAVVALTFFVAPIPITLFGSV
jgi:hypothetical protein